MSACWCTGSDSWSRLGVAEHLPDGTCPIREHYLGIEDSEVDPIEDARWSVWFFKPGSWLGWPIYFGGAEGCTRTLVIGTRWTGCIVFGLWRMRFDPECPGCEGRR